MTDLTRLSAFEAASRIAAGTLTAEALTEAHLARIAERDADVRAWAHLDPDQALAEARARDAERPRSPLHGVPVGVKDILDTVDMPTEYGARVYPGHRPPWDSAPVAMLRHAGMIVLGKTVTTEFAMRSPGATRNPHRANHTPGGSSSGSAAAVADWQVPLAIGTQTAGSVVRPAAYCGVVGYKPTHGRISRAGVKLLSESLDTIGVMGRDVRDVAHFAAILEGNPILPLPVLSGPPRFGICRPPGWDCAEPSTRAAMTRVAEIARAAGAETVEISLPKEFKGALEAQETIQAYESSRALAFELQTRGADLSRALKEYVAPGADMTRETYDGAREVQAICKALFWPIFRNCDALIVPSATGEAPANLSFTGSPIFNRIWTLLGVPAVNVPGLTGETGLPVGVTVVGPAGKAADILARAEWLQNAIAAA